MNPVNRTASEVEDALHGELPMNVVIHTRVPKTHLDLAEALKLPVNISYQDKKTQNWTALKITIK